MHKFIHFRVPIKGAYFLVLLTFLVSLSISFIAPVFPLYLKSLVAKEAYVGYITAAIAILLLIANFVVSKFLDRHKKRNLLKMGLFGSALTVAILSVINKLHFFLALEIFRSFFLISTYMTIALLIKDYASVKNIGKLEGMHFTISNTAWLIGPILGAMIAERYSISTVFLIGSIFPIAALFLVTFYPLKESNIKQNDNKPILDNIKDYFRDRDLRILYMITIGLIMWWAIIYTFTPLFIKESQLSTSIIGYLMLAITIPLILLEIPIGKLADRTGFKKYFFFGFLIIAISSALTYLFTPKTSLIFLVLASVGAAFLEPLREAYLFEKVKKDELTHRYSVFRTSVDIGQIFGPIIFSTVLLYTGFRLLYVFAAATMLLFALISLRIKDIKK